VLTDGAGHPRLERFGVATIAAALEQTFRDRAHHDCSLRR
jgi:hypothetical protein